MADDIVDKLSKSVAACWGCVEWGCTAACDCDCHDWEGTHAAAKAEIERLRAERDAEHALADQLAGELSVATEYADWPESDHLGHARSVLAIYEKARRG